MLLFVFIGLVTETVCSGKETQDNKTNDAWSGKVLRVQLNDRPGIQYLGICVAKELGLFAKEGLPEVEIVWNSHTRHSSDFLAENQAEIVTGWMSEGVVARAQGKPVVAIAAVSQHSSGCILVRGDVLGKTRVRLPDLNGKKIGIWFCHEVPPKLFMALHHIQPEYVVHHSDSNILFSERAVAGVFSTIYSVSFMTKYLSFRDHVHVFRFSDLNFDVPENSIFCSEQFLRAHPDVCQKFVKAMYLGWFKVLGDEEAALKIHSKYCQKANIMDDPFIARQQLAAWKTVLDLVPDLENNGQCKKERYDLMTKVLATSGLVDPKKIPSFESFFWPVLDESTMKRLAVPGKVSLPKNVKQEGQHE